MSQQLINIEAMIQSKKNILTFIEDTHFSLEHTDSWNMIYLRESAKILILTRRKNRLLGIIKE